MQARAILNDIQKATSAAVMATEQGSKAVEAGVKQSTRAGEAIKQLAENVETAARAVSQIVILSQQQSIGMDQICLAMANIQKAGTQNVESMRQTEGVAKNMSELGARLMKLVKQSSTRNA